MYSLGRHVHHDPRSRDYPAAVSAEWRPVSHRHYGPILDQGNLGSCTGNALAQALNTAPLHTRGEKLLKESDAVDIYSRATAIDDIDGQYPPTDTGSSGLAVCKAAQALGLIREYRHAFGIDQLRGALQLGPVIIGIGWHKSMFETDARGFVHPDGNVVGGHEIVAVKDTGDYIELINSWGSSWGIKGRFRLTLTDLDALLKDDGDATVPVP